jgi:hypothetical protein
LQDLQRVKTQKLRKKIEVSYNSRRTVVRRLGASGKDRSKFMLQRSMYNTEIRVEEERMRVVAEGLCGVVATGQYRRGLQGKTSH